MQEVDAPIENDISITVDGEGMSEFGGTPLVSSPRALAAQRGMDETSAVSNGRFSETVSVFCCPVRRVLGLLALSLWSLGLVRCCCFGFDVLACVGFALGLLWVCLLCLLCVLCVHEQDGVVLSTIVLAFICFAV